MDKAAIERAKEHFGKLLENQMKRMERMKSQPDWIDYSKIIPDTPSGRVYEYQQTAPLG